MMKKTKLLRLIIFLLVVSLSFSNFIFSVFADDFKLGSEPNGFRGIKWGTNISTLSNMEYIGGTLEEVYVRKGEILKIGGAKLRTIRYCFWKGRLFKVYVFSESGYALDEVVFKKFGVGQQSHSDGDSYYWFGKITLMVLDSQDGFRVLNLASQKIRKEVEAYDEKMAEEGARTGF